MLVSHGWGDDGAHARGLHARRRRPGRARQVVRLPRKSGASPSGPGAAPGRAAAAGAGGGQASNAPFSPGGGAAGGMLARVQGKENRNTARPKPKKWFTSFYAKQNLCRMDTRTGRTTGARRRHDTAPSFEKTYTS